MTPTTEVMRVVLEVPPTARNELRMITKAEATAQPLELLQTIHHVGTFPGGCGIRTSENCRRNLMNSGGEPNNLTAVSVSLDDESFVLLIILGHGWSLPSKTPPAAGLRRTRHRVGDQGPCGGGDLLTAGTRLCRVASQQQPSNKPRRAAVNRGRFQAPATAGQPLLDRAAPLVPKLMTFRRRKSPSGDQDRSLARLWAAGRWGTPRTPENLREHFRCSGWVPRSPGAAARVRGGRAGL